MRTTFRTRIAAFCVLVLLGAAPAHPVEAGAGRDGLLPSGAEVWPECCSEGITVYVRDRKVWLVMDPTAVSRGKAQLRRICAPIRSLRWMDQPDAELKFVPETKHWIFSWQVPPANSPVIQIEFDTVPLLSGDCPAARAAGDGSVMLHAFQARTFGEKLRFEPQWYKNTVGYWTVGTDYATWELTIDQPGTFSVAVLQGCGKSHGGSDATIRLSQGNELKAELAFQTIDTGHFQNFRWNHLGAVRLPESGAYQLRVDAKRIAKGALFDVRMIHLVRQADGGE